MILILSLVEFGLINRRFITFDYEFRAKAPIIVKGDVQIRRTDTNDQFVWRKDGITYFSSPL